MQAAFRFGSGLLFMHLYGVEIGGHFMTFTCPYFSPKVMVKFSRKVKGHFVMLIESAMHLVECNP